MINQIKQLVSVLSAYILYISLTPFACNRIYIENRLYRKKLNFPISNRTKNFLQND